MGLANYRQMFHDPLVWQATETTLKFIAFGVVPTVFISLWLAMLINFRFRFVSVGAVALPHPRRHVVRRLGGRLAVPLPGRPRLRVIDYVITKFGVNTPPDWLASTTWALPALDIITIWLSLPIATVLVPGRHAADPGFGDRGRHARRRRASPGVCATSSGPACAI